MSRRVVNTSSLTSIADKIREKSGNEHGMMFPDGFEDGVDEVYEAGKQSEYDRFWDAIQQNGARTQYTGTFCFMTSEIFKPKYDIRPTNAFYMFDHFVDEIDMVEHLAGLGVTLDTSACTNFQNWLLWSHIRRVGTIDLASSTYVNFYYAYLLETIDRLVVSNKHTGFNFQGCGSLKNVNVDGEIAASINLGESKKLTQTTIVSFFTALSTATSGLSITLSLAAVNKAFEIAGDDNNGSVSTEWAELVATRSNWTVNLV